MFYYFSLGRNEIKSVSKEVFQSLKSLKRLKLHVNKIENIPVDTFEGLQLIEELDLSMVFKVDSQF